MSLDSEKVVEGEGAEGGAGSATALSTHKVGDSAEGCTAAQLPQIRPAQALGQLG